MTRAAIVTGSTSGIGLGIARRLAQVGLDVTLNGFGEPDAIEAERAAIETEFGVRCRFDGADMARPEEIARLVAEAEAAHGAVDVVVSNAGIQFVSAVEEFPVERWDAILAVNLSAGFHLMRAAIPGMRRRGWGRIISVASAHALVASPFKSAYVAAKHGVAGLTKSVALEVARDGITVNAIAPGYVWTPLVERQIPDTMSARGLTHEEVVNDVMLRAQPTKRFVTIEEVASLAAFLASDEASSITGSVQSIDGGWTAQ